eukprot:1330868-Alexandrium_andersonii.AAC.1
MFLFPASEGNGSTGCGPMPSISVSVSRRNGNADCGHAEKASSLCHRLEKASPLAPRDGGSGGVEEPRGFAGCLLYTSPSPRD